MGVWMQVLGSTLEKGALSPPPTVHLTPFNPGVLMNA
jgi:hypothetical protein